MPKLFLLLLIVHAGSFWTANGAGRLIHEKVKPSSSAAVPAARRNLHVPAPKIRQKMVHPLMSTLKSRHRAALVTKPGATARGTTHATSTAPPVQAVIQPSTLSSNFQLTNLTIISLRDSPYFSVLPEVMYNSFNDSQPHFTIHLGNLALCPDAEDCSCCEMRPFSNWLRKNGRSRALKGIQCGPIKLSPHSRMLRNRHTSNGTVLVANHAAKYGGCLDGQ